MNEMKAERVNHANTSDDIIRYDDIKVGDLVTFKTHCFGDAHTYKGVVEYTEQLGLVVIVDGVQYEMRKAISIRKSKTI